MKVLQEPFDQGPSSRLDAGSELVGAALAQLDARTWLSVLTQFLADPHLGPLSFQIFSADPPITSMLT